MDWGAFLGEFALAELSDYIGRRNTALLSFLGALIFVILFSRAAANPVNGRRLAGQHPVH